MTSAQAPLYDELWD